MIMPIAQFSLTALLIELTPGPNMAYLAALTLADGKRTGFIAVAGVFFGLAIIGVLSALGLAALIEGLPFLYGFLRYAGCAFLLYLAYEGWRGAVDNKANVTNNKTIFFRALMTNLLNPKSAIFYVSVLPLFLIQGRNDITGQSILLAIIYVSIATAVHACIVQFADILRPYLVSGPHQVVARRLLAASLAVVAIWFFWGSQR